MARASFTISTLTAGNHTVAAAYTNADDLFQPSTGSLTGDQTVLDQPSQISTTTILTASTPSPTYGQSWTVTATVTPTSGSGTPTGTVQFVIDGSNFGSVIALVNGGATSTAPATLSAGPHTITASYLGDADFTASTAAELTQTVARAKLTVTAIDTSKAYGDPNPTLTSAIGGFVNGDTACGRQRGR